MVTAFLAVGVTTGVFLVLSVWLLISEKYLANYGSVKVDINQGSTIFERTGGVTLLNALYENKIFIPSACGGKGSCGYCKVKVVSGGGPILPTETGSLTRAEMKAGIRLACQVKIKEDISIVLPEEILSVKQFRARVSSILSLTYDIKEINFALIDPVEIEHHPGQYIQVEAPGPGEIVHRAYSISSPTYEKNKIQLIVRLVPGGIASTYLHGLKEGDEVAFTGPYGEFRLSEDINRNIVLVGGGCGMAPVKDIAYSVLEKWPARKVLLFFGARTTKDIFYLDQYRELEKKYQNFKVIYALSDPLADEEQKKWTGETGFVHLSVDKYLDKGAQSQAFLCGPPPMIEAVTDVLKEKGLVNVDIFYDKF
ncbi:MAG: 2Fe-2S iron-sulfur cluster binding domain-containing protein [Spirochaetales bacterium]|nr:MAG: 2Fe-2S iron-sulfur cluster binding domain-containing protein [Spirochaetales bacterium]